MSFVNAIWDMLQSAWDMLLNFFSGIVTMLSVTVSAVTLPAQLSLYVPSFLSACVLIVGSISIVKLILGWGNQ